MRSLAFLLILAGCAASGSSSIGDRDRAALERDLAGRVAGEAESCAPTIQGQGLRVVDERTVVLDQGRTIWVNRLEGECPGLRPASTIVVEMHGSRYCRGDRFRSHEPGMTIPGGLCVLSEWTPYRRPR